MKKILILSITCLLTISSYTQNKFGYIDSQELLLLMPERKTAEEEVQTFAKSLDSQLQAMTTEYQQSVQEYQNNQSIISLSPIPMATHSPTRVKSHVVCFFYA